MDNKECSGCSQKDGCRQTYEKLDSTGDKPIMLSVILAFLLPIAVFVGVVTICEYYLPQYLKRGDVRNIASFVIAAAATLAVMYTVKTINKRLMKNK